MHIFESRKILKALYDNYLSDMELYRASPEAILRSRTFFQNIYKELNKESKNFSPGPIEEKSKTRDFATSIQWLTMAIAMAISACFSGILVCFLIKAKTVNYTILFYLICGQRPCRRNYGNISVNEILAEIDNKQ